MLDYRVWSVDGCLYSLDWILHWNMGLELGTGLFDWNVGLECGTGTLLECVSNKCNCLRPITEALNSNCLRASYTLVQFPISTL